MAKRVIGTFLGLLGVLFGFYRLYSVLPVLTVWYGRSNVQSVLSAYLLIILLIAWILAVIGVLLGFATKGHGMIFFIFAAIMNLGVFIFCVITSTESADASLYSFLFFPIAGVLYLIAGILNYMVMKD